MNKHKGLKFISFLTILFLLLPLLMIVVTAFGKEAIIQFPIKGFTFDWFGKVFASRSLVSSLSTSLQLAFIASFIGILLGLPASYALTKVPSKLSDRLLSYFLSPSLIPGIVMGYALFQTLTLTFRLQVWVSLVLGHILVVLPYSIRILAAGLKEMDDSIEEAARSLGCKPVPTFFKVLLPNIKSSIIAAAMMSFINSFNNLPVSLFLKGPGINTLPVALMSHLEYNFDPTVSAISVIIMVGTFTLMMIIEKTTGLAEVQ
ncbi:ABC transporter permease subunit [Erysipelothrix sp. HDW6A]|uniref:ABC transporter permease n=1 Tax=Erysipelothrix sp. HDW6A TaxID=2714928 RepID=UPI00140DA992|nr:ABC transporter permease subunit [Erysipelothrix sp. HDW6A]QIK57894.1 ABC transporter permease subunit [Erysipelothrix sp. HDW6A]